MATALDPPPFVGGARYQVLEHLARYRFLTAAQLLRLRVGANMHQVYDRLRRLELHGFIKRHRNDRARNQPDIFFLTPAGAGMVAGADAPRSLNITGEIWHRMAIIDAHMGLRGWADAQDWHTDWVRTDFVRSGRHGTKATTTPMREARPYVPDAIGHLTDAAGRRRLFVIEVYWRGGAGLHHFRRKIDTVRAAAAAHAVEKHHGFTPQDGAARYLVVFADADTRRKACAGLPDVAGGGWWQFYFADHPALLAGFDAAWHDAAGNLRPLIDPIGRP